MRGYDARLFVNEDLVIVCLLRKYVGKKTLSFSKTFLSFLGFGCYVIVIFAFSSLEFGDFFFFWLNNMIVVISALKVLCLFAEKMYTKENENSSESFGPLI